MILRRQYRFVLNVAGLGVHLVASLRHLSDTCFTVDFYEDESDPISQKLIDMLNANCFTTGSLIFTDELGNFVQEWKYDGLKLSLFNFKGLSYNSLDPVKIEATFYYRSLDLVKRCSYKTADDIKQALVCHCGADKASTTHSTWCPKYV